MCVSAPNPSRTNLSMIHRYIWVAIILSRIKILLFCWLVPKEIMPDIINSENMQL